MSAGAALILSGSLAVALAALHLAAPWVRRHSGVPERWHVSFGGGLAAAYVFLHMLPEFHEHGEALRSLLPDRPSLIPLVELTEWTVALVGFVAYLALDLRAVRSSSGGELSARRVFSLQLGAYVFYNVLITYTLVTAAEAGPAFPVVFAVAMGLHFVITDRTMERNHPDEFDHRGRFILAGALLLGWVLGAVTGHGGEPVVAFTSAFLSGAVLLNVFKEEVHVDRDTSLLVFLAGTGTGVVLLFWITVAGG